MVPQAIELTDEQIAKKVQEGDLESYGELIKRYEPKMLRYARKFLFTNTAEDMVQEVFLKAYQNIQSFKTELRFSPWLYRIAHNEFINQIKKRGRENLSFFDPDTLFPHPIAADNPAEELNTEQTRKMLDSYLDGLDTKYREVLVLYFLEELSYREISDVLKVPIATVGVRIKRAKEALKNSYEKNLLKGNYERII